MLADLLLLALDLAIVVVVVRAAGALAVRVGQPRIAGEMVGAILIGPTVLGGRVAGVDGAGAGGLAGDVYPALAVDVLTWVGAVGMILYLLLVGLSIDPRTILRRRWTIAVLLVASVATMGLLALGASSWMEDDGGWRGPHGTSLAFVLALAAALAAHGVPIAARILEERGLLRSEVGVVVIAAGACATTLAVLVSAVAIQGADGAALGELALVIAVSTVLVAIAVALARSRRMRLGPHAAVGALLLVALAAGGGGELLIGTVLVGPLVVGIAARTDGFSARFLEARLGALVRGVLLPVFLGVAALHTNLRELDAGTLLPVLALIAAVVVVKAAAGYAGARAAGFGPIEARATGALLQCGGVMTIAISLDVLQAGIVSSRTHALLTLIGLVTTAAAGPLLARSGLRPGRETAESEAAPAVAGAAAGGVAS